MLLNEYHYLWIRKTNKRVYTANTIKRVQLKTLISAQKLCGTTEIRNIGPEICAVQLKSDLNL